jgi:hypothetical protein
MALTDVTDGLAACISKFRVGCLLSTAFESACYSASIGLEVLVRRVS